jgi:cytochrome c-type biogenesis protein CcmE
MKKNGRFMVGLVGVATVVTYLVWTGVSEAMVYYLTPVELMQKVEADPTFRDVGVRISGQVVPGSYARGEGQLLHHFTIHDLLDPNTSIQVEYADALTDTFSDDVEVVLEGRLREDGVFVATTLQTKCASRYEAAPEDLAG